MIIIICVTVWYLRIGPKVFQTNRSVIKRELRIVTEQLFRCFGSENPLLLVVDIRFLKKHNLLAQLQLPPAELDHLVRPVPGHVHGDHLADVVDVLHVV